MSDSQHLDDISIPDIEIDAGWPVSDITSIEDCDDAYSYLMSAVAEIEYQLELKELGVAIHPDPTWPARARRALKYKRAALQLVGYKRGRLMDAKRKEDQNSRDKALLEHIKSIVPKPTFHAWISSFSAVSESEAA